MVTADILMEDQDLSSEKLIKSPDTDRLDDFNGFIPEMPIQSLVFLYI